MLVPCDCGRVVSLGSAFFISLAPCCDLWLGRVIAPAPCCGVVASVQDRHWAGSFL